MPPALDRSPGQAGQADQGWRGLTSLIQAAKARARGYRTNRNLITMAYLIAGKLK